MSQSASTPDCRFEVATPGDITKALDVESWSVSRSLSSWGLPGQARVPSGVGTGSGTVTVDVPGAISPWSTEVLPGAAAQLTVSQDTGPSRYAALAGIVHDITSDGALASVRTLNIEDDIEALNRPALVREAFVVGPSGSYIDAAYLLDQVARSGGYWSVMPTDSLTRLFVPLVGCVAAEIGTADAGTTAATWRASHGVTPRTVPNALPATTYTLSSPAPTSAAISVLAMPDTQADAAQVEVRAYSGSSYASVILRVNTAGGSGWQASRDGGSSWVPISVPASAARVEFEVTWQSPTQVAIRERHGLSMSDSPSAWGAIVTHTGPSVAAASWTKAVISGSLTGVQVRAGVATDDLWRPISARIEPSGIRLQGIYVPARTSGWDLAQSVARATAAALWIDESGRLRYTTRAAILAQTPVREIETLTSLADRSWTISREDYADRLELTYSPPVATTVTDGSLPVWEASDVIEVPAHGTAIIEQDLDLAAASLAAWSAVVPGSTEISKTGSVWAARTAAKGGTNVTSGITVTSTLITPQRLRIAITSTLSAPTYMCDASGTPILICRANRTITPGEQQTVDRGASSDTALVPTSLDCGPYVQTADAASAVADDLWTALQDVRPVLQDVEVWPDASLRVTDLITLTDAETGISRTCAITGTSQSGSAGVYEQHLTLAILD